MISQQEDGQSVPQHHPAISETKQHAVATGPQCEHACHHHSGAGWGQLPLCTASHPILEKEGHPVDIYWDRENLATSILMLGFSSRLLGSTLDGDSGAAVPQNAMIKRSHYNSSLAQALHYCSPRKTCFLTLEGTCWLALPPPPPLLLDPNNCD